MCMPRLGVRQRTRQGQFDEKDLVVFEGGEGGGVGGFVEDVG